MRSIKLMKFLIFILTVSFFAAGCSAGSDAEGCPAGSEGCPCAEDEYGYLAFCDGPLTCEDGYCYDLGGDNDDDDDVSDDCTPGEERCTCDDGDCESGLQCVSNRCVDPQNPDGNDDDENNDGNDDDENPDDDDENDGNDDDEESDADDDEESDDNDDDEESDDNDDDEESDADDDEESDANNDDEESDADDDEESDDNPDDTDESDDNPDDTDESDDTTDESAGDTDESADESAGDTDESADDTDDNNQTDGECGGDGLISDFEDGKGVNDVFGTGLTDAEWDTFAYDGDVNLEVEDGDSGTCGSQALHFWGSGTTDNDESYLGLEFFMAGEYNPPDDNVVEPVDVSDYVGLQFKAKVGSGHKNAMRVNFSRLETEGHYSGGDCNEDNYDNDDVKCYNHMGRFLYTDNDAGSIHNEKVMLTDSWKTFTLCFDRDMHPQFMPSNIDVSLRKSLPKNLLKVQFLPNKSIDIGATDISDESPEIHDLGDEYDFWLDDVRFIKDSSACMANNPDYDFEPLNDPGGNCSMVPDASKFNGMIADLYIHWKEEFLQNGWVNMPEQTDDGSTSESQGYGLIITAAMGDEAAFSSIWEKIQSNPEGSTGLMKWSKASGENKSGTATDGDEDIAYGLLLGAKVFGGSYASEAESDISSIWEHDINGSVPRIKLGSNFNDDHNYFNPSYFTPYYYRVFSKVDSHDWSGVTSNGYQTVKACQSGGLVADWCTFEGTAVSADTVGVQVCGEGMCSDIVFAYEAARLGWRLGVDACWGSGSDASEILGDLVGFFQNYFDADDELRFIEAGWLLSSGQPHSSAVPNQASFIGPIGVAAKSTGDTEVLENTFWTTADILHSPLFNRVYYPTSLGLMSLLEMTGNIPHVE